MQLFGKYITELRFKVAGIVKLPRILQIIKISKFGGLFGLRFGILDNNPVLRSVSRFVLTMCFLVMAVDRNLVVQFMSIKLV